MANTKISDFTSGAPAQATDELVIARSGSNFKLTNGNIRSLFVGTANTFTASQTFTPATDTSAIIGTGYSLTGSASASFVDLAGTWNTSGTPTAVKVNITDTASNASSLLMDLQVGGSSRVNVRKDGFTTINGAATIGLSANAGAVTPVTIKVPSFGSAFDFVFSSAGGVTSQNIGTPSGSIIVFPQDASYLGTAKPIGFTTSPGASPSLFLTRRATANLQLGQADAAAPVAQTLSVQSVVAGTTNTAGANLTITGSQGTGTGAGGSIVFQVAPAGLTGSTPNGFATALTIASDRNATFAGNIYVAVDGFIGSTSVTSALRITNGLNVSYQSFQLVNATSGHTATLAVDAANTLALRNGVNAQRLNVYNTWTSATNYEAFKIDWITTANTVLVGTEKGSVGGTARALEFQTDGATRMTVAAAGSVDFPSTAVGSGSQQISVGRVIFAGEGYRVGNTYQVVWSNGVDYSRGIGANSSGGLAITNGSTGGQSLEMREMTAPAAPATNGVRIYAEDNGSGKTRLMALFATGVAQEIAIEP